MTSSHQMKIFYRKIQVGLRDDRIGSRTSLVLQGLAHLVKINVDTKPKMQKCMKMLLLVLHSRLGD